LVYNRKPARRDYNAGGFFYFAATDQMTDKENLTGDAQTYRREPEIDAIVPQFPQYGCFPRISENGDAWIHPDDRRLVEKLIPSERLMRRESFDGTYYTYRYGKQCFRLKPVLWLSVRGEGFEIGDAVETIGQGMERELFVGQIWGAYYVRRKAKIMYRLKRAGNPVPGLFPATALRLLENKQHVSPSTVVYPQPT